jgi:PKD repeat protein
LEYRWDFESTYDWTSWSRSTVATHSFAQTGERTVRLQVRDADQLIDETKIMIRVQNRVGDGPLARIFVDPTEGDTSTIFNFQIEPESFTSTPADRLEVRWDWESDGVWDTGWSTGRNFFHTFPAVASREVSAEVRDPMTGASMIEWGYYLTGKENDLVRTREIGRIIIKSSSRPTASFRTWPTSANPGMLIHFDASASQRATAYRWDFNADGKWDRDWNAESKVDYAFTAPGNFAAQLEVKNADGEIDRTEQTIVIYDPSKVTPEAKFTVQNRTNTASMELGAVRDEFYFNAGGSRDRDGSLAKLQVRWDFEGDGEWDTTFATSKTAWHRYTEPGDFRPLVEVLDEQGLTAAAEVHIRIVKNTAPEAQLRVTPATGTRETEFYFDANASTDSQSRSSDLTARFDFDGDGLWDTPFSRNKSERFQFDQIGKLSPRVEVRDPAGLSTITKISLEVTDPPPAAANFTVAPAVGTFQTNFEFDASTTAGETQLEYRWDFNSAGKEDITFDTGWSRSPRIIRRYREVGVYRVHLAVRNSAGKLSDFYRSVEVHPYSIYYTELQNRGILREAAPRELISRADFATLLFRASRRQLISVRGQVFTDLTQRDALVPYAASIVERGWLGLAADFAFNPTGLVTRGEAVRAAVSALYPQVPIYRGASHFTDVTPSSPYFRFANLAAAEGLLDPVTKFQPDEPVTEAEVVRLTARLLQKYDLSSHGAAPFSWQNLLNSLF